MTTHSADIVITERTDSASVAGMRAEFNVHYDPTLVERQSEIAALLPAARALIVRSRTVVDADLIAAGTELKAIGRLGVGVDNIDLEASAAAGIQVCTAHGANAVSVAEYVMATALILVRDAYSSSHRIVAGEWPREELMGHELAGKQLGLVGFGDIARLVAARARAFGMEVAAYDPFVPADDPIWADTERRGLGDVLASSDVVSIHVPLTDSTRQLIDGGAIATMLPGAILINTARGGVVAESAIVEALRAGRLGGAALDVFETEPFSHETGLRFVGVPNLVLTPHIAGRTHESDARVGALVAREVRRVLLESDST